MRALFAGFTLAMLCAPNTSGRDSKETTEVVIRLVLPESEPCVTQHTLPAEIAIRNMGGPVVALDMNRLFFSGAHFRAYSGADDGTIGMATLDVVGDPSPRGVSLPARNVTLQPGESYWVKIGIDVSDDLLSRPGLYAVSVDIALAKSGEKRPGGSATFESNWVFFRAQACKHRG